MCAQSVWWRGGGLASGFILELSTAFVTSVAEG
jgi:hypothetical protein